MTNVDSSIRLNNVDCPVADLEERFRSATEKQQLQLVDSLIDAGEPGFNVLIQHLTTYQSQGCPLNAIGLVEPVAAKVYHQLYQTGLVTDTLQRLFPTGIVPLKSARGVDYQPLQQLLVQQQWQAADKLHNLKLCEAASDTTLKRKWIYFTEIAGLPIVDLRTLNALWVAHSGGKFGYSVQRDIWLGVNQNWDKFWPKIDWKEENVWTRYPGSFNWSLDAPLGHLPLSNQLRGVQAIKALMTHSAWTPNRAVEP